MTRPSIGQLLNASNLAFTSENLSRAISVLYGNVGSNLDERDWASLVRAPNALEAAETALTNMYLDAGYLLRNAQHLVTQGNHPATAEVTYRGIYERLGLTYDSSWSVGTPFAQYRLLNNEQLDNLFKAPPAPLALELRSQDDTGSRSDDNLTNDRTVAISGTADPGSAVRLFTDDGKGNQVQVGDTVTAHTQTGMFTVTNVELNQNGVTTVTATATNSYGIKSASSVSLTITHDDVAPAAPGQPDLNMASDSNVPNDDITRFDMVQVDGVAEPGSSVQLFIANSIGNPQLLGAAVTADSVTGSYSAMVQLNLNAITTISAAATDAAGNVSMPSAVLVVTHDDIAPAPPVITGFLDDSGVVGDRITNDTTLRFSGTAEPGSRINVFADGNLIGFGNTDALGNWSFGTAALREGVRQITATAHDVALNISGPSAQFAVTIDLTPPVVTLDQLATTGGVINAITFSNTTNPNGLITVSGTGFENVGTIDLTKIGFVNSGSIIGLANSGGVVTHQSSSGFTVSLNNPNLVNLAGFVTNSSFDNFRIAAGAISDAAGNVNSSTITTANVQLNVSSAVANSGQLSAAPYLVGGPQDDNLTGDSANSNSFYGAGGNDVLTGATGVVDRFIFSPILTNGVDRILNFQVFDSNVRDVLDFVAGNLGSDLNFNGLNTLGVSLDGADAFRFVGPKGVVAAHDVKVVAFDDLIFENTLSNLVSVVNFLNEDVQPLDLQARGRLFHRVDGVANNNETIVLIRNTNNDVGVYLFRDSTEETSVEIGELQHLATLESVVAFGSLNDDNFIV